MSENIGRQRTFDTKESKLKLHYIQNQYNKTCRLIHPRIENHQVSLNFVEI